MTCREFSYLAAFLMILCPVLAPAQNYAVDYQVIINAENPTQSLTRDQLRKIFLKKMLKWDSGTPVVPVDQAANSPVRAVFTKIVHEKPVSAIASYWQQQIFAGREVPPAEKAGDAAVVAFVKANPGAIGYVTGGTSAAGIKPLIIR
ncbi:MAG: substrate-binding domain-containing protein [Vicinamibacteria bacterium]|nr:substrate-binding domain-containing protein [Vicinamibacteria bacterium]